MAMLGRLPGSQDPRPGATVLACPASHWDKEGWRERAACRHVEAKLFFTAGTTGIAVNQIAAAKAVCGRCPVRDAGLQFAFETNQEWGVWGGTDEDERRLLRRAWRSGRKPLPRSPSAVRTNVVTDESGARRRRGMRQGSWPQFQEWPSV